MLGPSLRMKKKWEYTPWDSKLVSKDKLARQEPKKDMIDFENLKQEENLNHRLFYKHVTHNYNGQNFFITWFTNPPTVIFWKAEKKNNF